ncbi:MAG: ABC transporter permease, partial [Acidobacteriota bacterium]
AARGDAIALQLTNRHRGPGAEFYRLRVARAVYTTAAELVLLAEQNADDGSPAADPLIQLRLEPRPYRLAITQGGVRRTAPSGFEQAVPGIIVMFTMLVLLTTGTHSLTVERERGLLRRLAATPIDRGAIVAGKWLALLALGAVQIGVGMVTGAVLFGVDWTDGWPALMAVLGAWAAFNAALTVLLANVTQSAAQASSIGVLITMLMAALGGCWWPIEITPSWMQTLSMALPAGWAMDAVHRVVSFGDGGAAVLPHLAAMSAAALLCGILAARRFRFA